MRNKYYSILFFIILTFVNNVEAQKSNKNIEFEKELSSLIKKGLFEEALLLNLKTVEEATKNNDKQLITSAHIKTASILCIYGQHLESLRYLDLALKIATENNYKHLESRILINYGRNYSGLNINKKAIEYYDKSIEICKKIKPLQLSILSSVYINKADAFLDTEYKSDSTLFYLHKAIKIKKNAIKYAIVANYYLKEEINIDSAKHYLNKSKLLIDSTIKEKSKATILHADANFNKAIGNYKEAIVLYKKSLKIYKNIKNAQKIKSSYKLISETYSQLQNKGKMYEFLLKYANITDSINTIHNKRINILINSFLKEQEKDHQEKEKKYSFFIVIIILLFSIIITLIIYTYKQKRKKIIIEKEQIINQKNIESIKLKEKLNVAFDEVILLAKNNDSSFLIRFQEVYPDVCKKLLKINPKLVNTELSLCAMIWLNFSSKDIASYTNIQPKTVQTKKYRLRKKLNIPKNTIIYVWIKSL